MKSSFYTPEELKKSEVAAMAKSKPIYRKHLSVLFTTIGRRVSLLNSFRRAAKQLGLNVTFVGTDARNLSSALHLCDRKYMVKPISHPDYLKQLLAFVRNSKIDLLIPTIDTNLLLFAKNKAKFARLGCRVLISSPEVIDICGDKRRTYRFLIKNGFDTPEVMTPRAALAKKSLKYPRFLKPWDGSASRHTTMVHNRKELAFYSKIIPNCIVQNFVEGTEYTCDAFVGADMKVHCVVPRKRIEVRAGEVSKSQVVKNKYIMNLTAKLVETLGAGPGVITIQLILDLDKKIHFIEINPRFGGGAPLSIKAGANFPKWVLQELVGQKPDIKFDGFEDNLIMLRYDAEVWLKNSQDGRVKHI
jgi:carbamoyl-phosphate synthase large subunit